MPEDCIREILTKLITDVDDLYSVAVTSKRLHDIAQLAFKCDFETYERIDEKILRLFGSKIKNITIKLRTFESIPTRTQFAEGNLIKTYRLIKMYCDSKTKCQIKLANTYKDFKNNPENDEMNWHNNNGGGFLLEVDDDADGLFPIKSEAELIIFIERFNNYLVQRENDVTAYGYGDIVNYHNDDDILNRSDVLPSFDVSDSTNEKQIGILGQNLKIVKVEPTVYYFDVKLENCGFDQHEIFRILHKYCPNITTLKVELIDLNIFRRHSFQQILQNLTKLNITFLNGKVCNYEDIKVSIKNVMTKCFKIESLKLHVLKSEYLEAFLHTKYSDLQKITILSGDGDLYNKGWMAIFQNINPTVKQIRLQTKIID